MNTAAPTPAPAPARDWHRVGTKPQPGRSGPAGSSSVPSVLVVAATARELASIHGVETLVCGVGPVEAAVSTAAALARQRPTAVLHIGIAGARTLAPRRS